MSETLESRLRMQCCVNLALAMRHTFDTASAYLRMDMIVRRRVIKCVQLSSFRRVRVRDLR